MEMIDSFFPFAATTRSITVRVAVSYLPEQSHPALGRWFWAYHVRVENHGDDTVQLISRHWRISDGRGQTSEVEGERSEEHTSELQSLMRISDAVFGLNKKNKTSEYVTYCIEKLM